MQNLPEFTVVPLEMLDDHLKAILKIKIREFVHLNPVFNCIPSIDVDAYFQNRKGRKNAEANLRDSITRESVEAISNGLTEDAARLLEQLAEVETQLKALRNDGVMELLPRTYFAGYDVSCPHKGRPLPHRRRRQTFV
jgi:hypothetical protein